MNKNKNSKEIKNQVYLNIFDDIINKINNFNNHQEIKEIKNFFDVPKYDNANYQFYKKYQLIIDKKTKNQYFFPRNTSDLCFFNSSNPTYYCLHCNSEFNNIAGNSHSVSNSHIQKLKTTKDKKIYGFRDSFFNNIKNLFNNIEIKNNKVKLKDNIKIEDSILYDLGTGSLSIFPGFCKSNLDCDGKLFLTLDNSSNNINLEELKYEIMYRTITWKLLKLEQETIYVDSIFKLYNDKPLFKEIYTQIIIESNSKIEGKSKNENFNEVINSIKNKSLIFEKLYLLLKNKNYKVLKNFEIHLFETENTDFIGINYYNKNDSVENEKFFEKINQYSKDEISEFFTGILYFKNKCYGFFINTRSNKRFFNNLILTKKARVNFIKTALIEINNSNTFINSNEIKDSIEIELGIKKYKWENDLNFKLKELKRLKSVI